MELLSEMAIHEEKTKSTSTLCADVCIVGAGLSGLFAARKLLANDYTGQLRIVLVEARGRAGGRTNSVACHNIKNAAVDIGGQWLGPGQHRMVKLVEEFGLTLVEQEFDEVFQPPSCSDVEDDVNDNQSLIEFANMSFNPLHPEESEEIKKFMSLVNNVVSTMSPSAPWDVQFASEYDSCTVEQFVLRTVKTRAARTEIFMFVRALLACEPSDCSFLFFLFAICSGEGMASLADGPDGAQKWYVKGGSQQISNKLLQSLKLHRNFTFIPNFEVCSVNQFSTDSETLCSVSRGGSVEDWSEAVHTVKCKRTILAMSPAVASQYIRFTPALPEEKARVCQGIRPARCVKIILSYPKAFWEEERFNFTDRFGDVDKTEVGYMHNILKSQLGEYPALIGLITGGYADRFALLSQEERREAVFKQLSTMYGCGMNVASQPVEYWEKNWSEEMYSQGCFSGVFPPRILTTCKENIRAPTGNVHWAGTETASFYVGYMEGASSSGERAAQEVIDALRPMLPVLESPPQVFMRAKL